MTDQPPPPAAAIARLLKPRSVAIVGASDKPGALGASVLGNLDRMGFAGAIHLVNPKRDEIAGRLCVRNPADLPDGIDVAVLAIPAPAVLDTVRALAGKDIGSVVIFSAGFAEGGEEGLAAQRELARLSAEHGFVVEGPNCLGLINFVDGTPLTFVEMPDVRLAGRPGVAIVSQSGAMAAVVATTLFSRDVGVSYFVSTGNEAASGVEDYLEHMIADLDTRVIGMVVEQFRKPARFLKLAARAREAGKPIVLLHPGKSSAARESAATHTGAMAGDYALMRAKVERAGVIVADSLEELGDIVDLALRSRGTPAGGCAVLTESGAFKALVLDLAEDIGLDLPEPGQGTRDRLRAAMPDFIPVSNPMDLTAQALVDPDLYRRTLEPLLDDPAYGSIVLGIIQTDVQTSSLKFVPIIDAIRALDPGKPVIFAGIDEGAPIDPAHLAALRSLNVPYFPSPDRAFRALAKLTAHAARAGQAGISAGGTAIQLPAGGGVIPEHRAKALLGPLGIPFPTSRLATDLAEAEAISAEIGYPVVLKAQSAELSHKSDAGGVAVGIADPAALATAWAKMQSDVGDYLPGVPLDGILVEAMGKRGTELIVGVKNDPEWGGVILAGFGGVQAEILKDVRLLTPDLTIEEIVAELDKLKSAPLLRGFRGSPPLDVAAVADIIARLGRLIAANPRIREIDLNPVIVYPQGEGAVALDALMLVDPA